MVIKLFTQCHRYTERCEAILNGSGSGDFPREDLVEASTIYVHVDATGNTRVCVCTVSSIEGLHYIL